MYTHAEEQKQSQVPADSAELLSDATSCCSVSNLSTTTSKSKIQKINKLYQESAKIYIDVII